MSRAIFLGLVHHPIVNKFNKIVTTSVTNMDIHDISRSCRTFGIKKYFLITPMKAQQRLVERITGYWESDEANCYNPDRASALQVAKVVDDIQTAIDEISLSEGATPHIVVTSAKWQDKKIEMIDLLEKIGPDKRPIFILFGTGHGLADEVVKSADFCLSPIVGSSQDGYNHLSVRSAVAIYCDRLRMAEISIGQKTF